MIRIMVDSASDCGKEEGVYDLFIPLAVNIDSREYLDGVDLDFEDAALRAIAQKAITRKSGARGLRAIIEDALMGTMFELPSRGDVERVVVTENVITEGSEPTLVPGEPKRKMGAGKARREGTTDRRPSVS